MIEALIQIVSLHIITIRISLLRILIGDFFQQNWKSSLVSAKLPMISPTLIKL